MIVAEVQVWVGQADMEVNSGRRVCAVGGNKSDALTCASLALAHGKSHQFSNPRWGSEVDEREATKVPSPMNCSNLPFNLTSRGTHRSPAAAGNKLLVRKPVL